MLFLVLFLVSAVEAFGFEVVFQLMDLNFGRHASISKTKWGVTLGVAVVVVVGALALVLICMRGFNPHDWIQGAFAFSIIAVMSGGLVGFLLADSVAKDNLWRLLKK